MKFAGLVHVATALLGIPTSFIAESGILDPMPRSSERILRKISSGVVEPVRTTCSTCSRTTFSLVFFLPFFGGGFFGGGQKASTAPSEAMGPIETAKEIYADGGWQAFTAGTLSRGLYWAPAISIFLTLYCTLRQLALQLLEAQVLAA